MQSFQIDFLKENIQMDNQPMKRCPMLLIVRKKYKSIPQWLLVTHWFLVKTNKTGFYERQTDRKHRVLVRVWNNWKAWWLLLVSMQNGVVVIENDVVIPQKGKHRITI